MCDLHSTPPRPAHSITHAYSYSYSRQVTDHERKYTLSFWAKASGNPKPRPHVTFQDEDEDYAYISGEHVQLSSFWHQYEVPLVVPYRLRGHNVVTNLMVRACAPTYLPSVTNPPLPYPH